MSVGPRQIPDSDPDIPDICSREISLIFHIIIVNNRKIEKKIITCGARPRITIIINAPSALENTLIEEKIVSYDGPYALFGPFPWPLDPPGP